MQNLSNFKQVKPAFLKDVHFYGQGSRKRSLLNASKNSANKRTVCVQNETTCDSSASADSRNNTGETVTHGNEAIIIVNDTATESTSQACEIAETTSGTCSAADTTSQTSGTTSQSTGTTSQTSGTTSQTSGTTSQSTGTTSQTSGTTSQTSGTTSQTSGTTSQTSGTTSQTSMVCNTAQSTCSTRTSVSTSQTTSIVYAAATEEQEAKCFATLNIAVGKAIVLRLVPPYAKELVPKITLPSYPKPITDLYDPAALLLTYPDLLTKCKRVYALYKVLYILLTAVVYIFTAGNKGAVCIFRSSHEGAIL